MQGPPVQTAAVILKLAILQSMPAQLWASLLRKDLLQASAAGFKTSAKPFAAVRSSIRVYRYVIDVHGQLFLHDTIPKNLTSCFKNTEFLDFFYSRIRPNPFCSALVQDDTLISRRDILSPPISDLAQGWTDVAPYNGKPSDSEASKDELWEAACKMGNDEGYQWISPCGPELNLIRTQDTPIVYHELSQDGKLRWAGTKLEAFRPEELVVDPSNGYVYHPSPSRPNSRSKIVDKTSPYGKHSLLGSNLVLSRFAEGLEIDPDQFHRGQGGSIEWNGRRYQLGVMPAR